MRTRDFHAIGRMGIDHLAVAIEHVANGRQAIRVRTGSADETVTSGGGLEFGRIAQIKLTALVDGILEQGLHSGTVAP